MLPDAFAAALRIGPAVVLLQPRAHNPTGVSMSLDAGEGARVRAYRSRSAENAIVLEDDHSGAISTAPVVTLRDLDAGARAARAQLLEVARPRPAHRRARRTARARRPGRVAAAARAGLDVADDAGAAVRAADRSGLGGARSRRRATPTRRGRRGSPTALRGHGLDVHAGDGINTWLRVADERDAIVRLTAAGIRVAPGGPFLLGRTGGRRRSRARDRRGRRRRRRRGRRGARRGGARVA